MAYNVFLSHSGKDETWLRALEQAAVPLGITLYAYERDSQPGAELKEKILSALERSDAVVALLTPVCGRRPHGSAHG